MSVRAVGSSNVAPIGDLQDVAKQKLLMNAVEKDRFEEIEKLLTEGIDPNFQIKSSNYHAAQSPLEVAVRKNSEKAVQLLTAVNANPNISFSDGESPIITAVRNKNAPIVKMLMDAGVILDCTPKFKGKNILHYAVKSKSSIILESLLKSRPPSEILNAQDFKNDTPIHIAAKKGYVEIARMLLGAGADPNLLNKKTTHAFFHFYPSSTSMETPLYIATKQNNIEMMNVLLESNASPNILSKYIQKGTDHGGAPLHIAIKKGNDEAVDLLLEKGANPDLMTVEGASPLTMAAILGKNKTIELLLKKNAKLNSDGIEGTPLHAAAAGGHIETIQLLMDKGLNPNVQSKECLFGSPLHYAIGRKNIEAMKLLLDAGADPHDSSMSGGFSCLHIISSGNSEALKMLIELGVNPNTKAQFALTPLHFAILNSPLSPDNIKILLDNIKTLLDEKADPNAQIDFSYIPYGATPIPKESQAEIKKSLTDGFSPLHLAVNLERLEETLLLLANEECNVNIQDKNGNTPLHIAIINGKTSIIEALLESKKCDLTIQNDEGNTALHLTTSEEITKLLLEAGTNSLTSIQNKEGNTPLHNAIIKYKTSIIKALLESQKCDLTIQNDEGNTALHLTTSEEITKLLLEAGADRFIKNKEGHTPLEHAAMHRSNEYMKLLVSYKGERGKTPALHTAIDGGKIKAAELLLSANADPNSKDETGQSPLYKAVAKKLDAIVQPLLTAGALPNVGDVRTGTTPLFEAVKQKKPNLVKLLLGANADPNIEEGDSRKTPLAEAIEQNDLESMKLLLNAGVNANTKF